ncbi:hypothetical protein [Variovorax sp. WDL1]|uniref:hypothetical protein n=1 Tax=Variovorax sp. WDL1 TaxID=207745 RepID=UPI001E324E90|nr:hypothetical protein [Variovorax sp. WDL1]
MNVSHAAALIGEEDVTVRQSPEEVSGTAELLVEAHGEARKLIQQGSLRQERARTHRSGVGSSREASRPATHR